MIHTLLNQVLYNLENNIICNFINTWQNSLLPKVCIFSDLSINIKESYKNMIKLSYYQRYIFSDWSKNIKTYVPLVYPGYGQPNLSYNRWHRPIGGFMQIRHNSTASALEFHLFGIKPSGWCACISKWYRQCFAEIFSNVISWMVIFVLWFKFHWSLFLSLQLITS